MQQLEETKCIQLTEQPPWEALFTVLTSETHGEVPWGSISMIEQTALDPSTKWTQHFGPPSAPTLSLPAVTPLHEIATVKRGILTGANDYFCLTKDELETWDLNPDAPYLVPLIRNAHRCQHYTCTPEDHTAWHESEEEAWLLYLPKCETADLSDGPVQRYLEHGRESGILDGYVTSNRTPWYAVDRRAPAPILATYMSSGEFRFIANTANVRSLNNLHNIYPHERYSPTQVKALLAYLNSDIAGELVTQHGRGYATGLQKLEPGELKHLPVINPGNLATRHVTTLATQFETLCCASRSNDADPATVIADIDAYLHQLAATPSQSKVNRSATS